MESAPTVGKLPISALAGDDVRRVTPAATLLDVAIALADADIGVIAVEDHGQLVGVVSERDVVRALAHGLVPETTRALDVASKELVWCDQEATVDMVAVEMLEHWVRHVFVERDGRLVGVVSARDLLGAYADDDSDLT
jgi:CBS domain-containing protein